MGNNAGKNEFSGKKEGGCRCEVQNAEGGKDPCFISRWRQSLRISSNLSTYKKAAEEKA